MAWRGARGERGAVAVEAAVVLAFVVIPLICGIIAYGVMLSFRAALSQAASEGARAAVGAPVPCPTSGSCAGIDAAKAAVDAQLGNDGYSCESVGMTCSIQIVAGGSSTAPDCASGHYCALVTVSYAYADHPRVWMPFMHPLLPSNLSFTSMVQVS